MVTTKKVGSTIPEIETALKGFFGEMVKIEYLENCLKQILPNIHAIPLRIRQPQNTLKFYFAHLILLPPNG